MDGSSSPLVLESYYLSVSLIQSEEGFLLFFRGQLDIFVKHNWRLNFIEFVVPFR